MLSVRAVGGVRIRTRKARHHVNSVQVDSPPLTFTPAACLSAEVGTWAKPGFVRIAVSVFNLVKCSICITCAWFYFVSMRLQHSVSLAAHPSVDWRHASRAHWVSTSLVLAPAHVCPALRKPPQSSEEPWTRASVEVSFISAAQALSSSALFLIWSNRTVQQKAHSSFLITHLLRLISPPHCLCFIFFFFISVSSPMLCRSFLPYWPGPVLPLSSGLLPT